MWWFLVLAVYYAVQLRREGLVFFPAPMWRVRWASKAEHRNDDPGPGVP